MDWMSPMDASFLHIEGPNNPMHIGGVSIFEGPPPPFEELRSMVEGKLALTPRLFRCVVKGLGRQLTRPAAAAEQEDRDDQRRR